MLEYLNYLLFHKLYVLYFGWQLHVPLWQLLIHDWSKYTWEELDAYSRKFYLQKDNTPDWVNLYFRYAWLHHIHCNPHHWEHWRLGDNYLTMPKNYVLEMIADWKATGMSKVGRDDAYEFYFDNPERIKLHPDTRVQVENLLRMYRTPHSTADCTCGVDKFWSKKPWYKHQDWCAIYKNVVGEVSAIGTNS